MIQGFFLRRSLIPSLANIAIMKKHGPTLQACGGLDRANQPVCTSVPLRSWLPLGHLLLLRLSKLPSQHRKPPGILLVAAFLSRLHMTGHRIFCLLDCIQLFSSQKQNVRDAELSIFSRPLVDASTVLGADRCGVSMVLEEAFF